jgi:hypothetical protein
VLALLRNPNVRLWLRYLAPAPLVFVALFLLASPVSDLVLPGEERSAGASDRGGRAPVVMLMLDEFPLMSLLDGQGRVDGRLYPNLRRLARSSTFYRNTTTVSPLTPVAVPAALTGTLPRTPLAPTHAQYPDTLFTLLSGSHDMKVQEIVTTLCPDDLCPDQAGLGRDASVGGLLGDSWRVWRQVTVPGAMDDRDVAQSLVEQTAIPEPRDSQDVRFLLRGVYKPVRFDALLAGLRRDEGPTLHFLHLLMPHQPWRYLPSGRTYDDHDVRKRGKEWRQDEWPWLQTRQRLLLQTVFLDRLVGQLIDRLERTGLWDEAVVVLTADHGLSMTPGQSGRRLTDDSAAELLWVPLFVKAPRQQEAVVDDRNVQLVDVLPTVADLLGVEVPWDVDGVSAAGPERRPPGDKVFFRKPGKEEPADGPRFFPEMLRGLTDGFAEPADGPEGLFAVGPHRDLVGTAVDAHDLLPAAGARATLTDPEQYGDVDVDGATLPAHVRGQLVATGDRGPAAWAVVAVNGRIAGVTGFYDGDDRRFASIASEGAFRDGANDLALFLVRGEPRSARLEPVTIGRP